MSEYRDDQPELIEDEGGNESGAKVMGFLEHLEELRWALIKPAIVFAVTFGLAAVFLKNVADVLNWPLHKGFEGIPHPPTGLVTMSPMGIFSVYMQICFLASLLITLPFLLYSVSRFIAPALTRKERRILIPACLSSLILFLVGAAFAYFLLVPGAIHISAYFNRMLGYDLVWSADRYYSLLVWMVLGMGATFQFPMLIQILVYIGIVNVAKLRSLRRIMIVVFFIIAAVITPTPDFMTQTIVAVPMILLYEVSILVASRLSVMRESQRNAESAD